MSEPEVITPAQALQGLGQEMQHQGLAVLAELIGQCNTQEELPNKETLRGLFARRLENLLEEALAFQEDGGAVPTGAAPLKHSAGEAEKQAGEQAGPFAAVAGTAPKANGPMQEQETPDITLTTHEGEGPSAPLPGEAASRTEAGKKSAKAQISRRELLANLVGRPAKAEAKAPVAPPAPAVQEANAAAGKAAVAALLAAFDALLDILVTTNPAIATCTTAEGITVYYIRTEMSDVYAGILAGKGNPPALLANVVRENSQVYPRPVPLDLFEYPPFDFTPEVVQECLQKLAATPEWADIRFVESAVGTVYLYSTQYLDHDHAEFLAERADTGLIMNP
ncbi:hypothetical protein [Desulfovibrio cuneatus]|uniref:hypothetical protein n=1 Tax=Desulfovibrio cuneatus TaxID=159728 RepID=UPI00042A358F|nr:hypothetical protein [Desulfovibrio cuneatus]